MKIRYSHIDDADLIKIHDTVKTFNNPKNGPRVFNTQEEFDAFELRNFERDLKRGIILSYEIIED